LKREFLELIMKERQDSVRQVQSVCVGGWYLWAVVKGGGKGEGIRLLGFIYKI
jgi:hypothetical protein